MSGGLLKYRDVLSRVLALALLTPAEDGQLPTWRYATSHNNQRNTFNWSIASEKI